MSYFGDTGASAIALIGNWLAAEHPAATQVSKETLAARGFPHGRAGWRVPLYKEQFGILILDEGFPYDLPRVVLEGANHGTDPHVENGLLLCLDGDEARADTRNPIAVVDHVLKRARSLAQENSEGANKEDYQLDFKAYWIRSAASVPRVLSLLSDDPGSRAIRAFEGHNITLLAEDDEALLLWLTNRFGEHRRTTSPALLGWLDALPTPPQYPQSLEDLRHLAPDLQPKLDELLLPPRSRMFVALRGPTGDGRIHGGVVRIDAAARGSSGWTAGRPKGGFRPGRGPPTTVVPRRWAVTRIGETPVRSALTRLPTTLPSLGNKRATVIGCGALGAGVARLLVQSGLGKLRLIDPETLGYENIGRHELGAAHVGRSKASALAEALKQAIPHVKSIVGLDEDWISIAEEEGDTIFDEDDLVICLTGDWNSESALSDFHRAKKVKVPVLYGWLEHSAGAAHAVALSSQGEACFRCGFDALGNLHEPITSWSVPPAVDGCAGPSSPFGAIELSHAQAMIADFAVDLLTEVSSPGVRRVWYGRIAKLEALGGRWNRRWMSEHGDPGDGGRIAAVDWSASPSCSHG